MNTSASLGMATPLIGQGYLKETLRERPYIDLSWTFYRPYRTPTEPAGTLPQGYVTRERSENTYRTPGQFPGKKRNVDKLLDAKSLEHKEKKRRLLLAGD